MASDLVVSLQQFWESFVSFWMNPTLEAVDEYLFQGRHFPCFFVFEVIWICLIIRRFAPHFEWFKSYLVAGFMSLFGRALAAFVTLRNPPLLEEPLYIPLFTILWFLVNCSPFDLVHKILSSGPILLILQNIYTVIQVREVVHGVDIGFSSFGTVVGAILLSAMLSSTSSFIWLLFENGTREFSNQMILRNLLVAFFYLQLLHKPSFTIELPFPVTAEYVRMYALIAYLSLGFVNNLVFGLRGRAGIDVTLLSYIGKLLTYCGDK